MFYDGTLDVFFNQFSEDCIYTEYGQSSITIQGIFDSPGTVITIGAVSTYIEKPQVRVKSSDVPSISGQDTFVIRSKTYKVVSPNPDGTGVTTVILAEGKR